MGAGENQDRTGQESRVDRRPMPDLPVTTDRGHQGLFYTDFVCGRVVMVNFMSVIGHAENPAMANLQKVARLLGGRLGTSVHMVSLTTDATNDNPLALRRFAERLGTPPGWTFLTGEKATIDLLRAAFFRRGAEADDAEAEQRRAALLRLWGAFDGDPRRLFCSHPSALDDCSAGLVRYGNEPLDLWGSVPARADPALIVERLSWIVPRPETPATLLRRGGPFPPASI